jgi:hypothetical protein
MAWKANSRNRRAFRHALPFGNITVIARSKSDEAIQTLTVQKGWIASLRSQ